MINSNLELKVRIIKNEIEINKKEEEKFLNVVLGIVGCFISLIIGSIYFFVIRKEYELWKIVFVGFAALFTLLLGLYWYSKYQKKKKKLLN